MKDRFLAKLAYLNMKKDFLMTGFRVVEIGALIATQFGCKPAPTISTEPSQDNTHTSEVDPNAPAEILKITSGELRVVKDLELKEKMIASLPANKPESLGDFDVFNIRVGDKDIPSIMYPILDNTTVVSLSPTGVENKTLQSVALYTEFVDATGVKSWVRLIAVNPDPNAPATVWVYDPKGFPGTEQVVDMNRAVLGYGFDETQNKAVSIKFQPLFIQPNYIKNYDYTQAVDVSIVGDIPAGMKVQAMLVPFDTPTQTATAKPGETATETSTAKPAVEAIDISNPEKFRKEEWDYLISPEYLAELQRKEKAGELPSVSKNAVYIKPGFVSYVPDNKPDSQMLTKYGIDAIFKLSNEATYLNTQSRPFTLVDAVKTTQNGIKLILLTYKWENSDKTYAFSGQLIFDNGQAKEWIGDIVNPTRYPTGSYFVKNSDRGDGCKALIDQTSKTALDSSGFCNYYYNSPEIFLQKDLYIKWSQTGKIINTNTLPIAIASSDPISK
jgi:hypothetical protein